jgi:hypothetical protein
MVINTFSPPFDIPWRRVSTYALEICSGDESPAKGQLQCGATCGSIGRSEQLSTGKGPQPAGSRGEGGYPGGERDKRSRR